MFRNEEKLFLISELWQGTPLIEEFEKGKKYSEKQAAYIIWQLVLAIDYCHKKGVCHREIKLDNIMIDPTSLHIKLIEFGHACL